MDSTVFIDQNGVPNRVFTDGVTNIPRRPQDIATAARTTDTDQEVEAPTTKYVVDWIVGHLATENGIQYLVRWYGYSPIDDTSEPADGFPEAFIDRRWKSRVTTCTTARCA